MTGNFDDIYDVNSIFLKTASEKIHESFGSTESELNKYKKEAFSIKMPEAMNLFKSHEFDLSGLPTRHQVRMMMQLQVPKLPDPPSSKLNLKTIELPQVPKFPDPTQLSGAVLDSKTTEIPQFNVREHPALKPFQTKPFSPSTEFNDPSSGFGQYEAVSQEDKDRAKKAEEQAEKTFEKREKNRATRTRIVSGLKEQSEAVSSSGFLSWSKQQTRADKSEKSRFDKARKYYKKNIDIIKDQNSAIEKAKSNFLKHNKKSEDMISDASIDRMNVAFEEVKQAYNQEVYDAKLAGIEAPEFETEKIDKQIAQKVFGKTGKAEISAVKYMRIKTHGEELIDRAQKRKDVIGKYLAPVVDKDGDRIARKSTKTFGMGFNQKSIKNMAATTTEAEKEIADIVEDVKPKGGLGWKGKAAIFGGVALGALALVGVASMVMSGGRQQNSNLYNPYQAMY